MARLRASYVSDVTQNLSNEALDRYKDKIKQIGLLFDPYEIAREKFVILSSNTPVIDIPAITYPDIYHYLIEYPDYFSHRVLKTYKSLEAYNFVTSGWVSDVEFLNTSKEKHER